MSAPRLFVIEQALEDLMDQGAQAELDGDAEAAAVFYQQLQEYLTQEAAKVTSYVGLIRSREATVAAAKAEKARIDAILKAAEADVERLKANALAVMQRFDVKELKATPGGGLRRQGNGGLEPLEIPDPALLPIEHRIVAVTMTNAAWSRLLMKAGSLDVETLSSALMANHGTIREALKQRVACPKCKGKASFDACGCKTPGGEFEGMCSGKHDEPCPQCGRDGTVPATVPGARLLPKGEHIRITPSGKKELEP